MDGQAIGAAAVADVGLRLLPSEAIGPRAAGTRSDESGLTPSEARLVRAGDAKRVTAATRP